MISYRTPGTTVAAVFLVAGTVAGCTYRGEATSGQAGGNARQAGGPCKPLETSEPNAVGQKAAVPGQTRACAITSQVRFDVTVVAKGLEHPWAVEPLESGDLLVTERPGR